MKPMSPEALEKVRWVLIAIFGQFHPSIHHLYTLYVRRLILCRVAGIFGQFVD